MSLEEVLAEVRGMNKKFDSLRNDVDSLMSRERSKSPVRKSPTTVQRSDGVHLLDLDLDLARIQTFVLEGTQTPDLRA